MQLVLLDLLLAQELVDDVLSHVKALWLESELAMDIDDPFEQKCSRGVSDFGLNLRNVLVVNHELDFFLLHILKVFLRVLGDGLRVLDFEPINLWHLLHFCLEIIQNSLTVNSLYSLCMVD